MRVKKFQAKDMAEAMKMVKVELGPNAIILHTRDTGKGLIGWLTGSRGVEVTAALDPRKEATKGKSPTENSTNKSKSTQKPPLNEKTGRSVDYQVTDHNGKQKTPSSSSHQGEKENPLLALSKKLVEEKQQKDKIQSQNQEKKPNEGKNVNQPKKNEEKDPSMLEKRLSDLENRLIKLTGLIEHLAPSLASGQEVPSVPSRTRELYNHLLEHDVDERLALTIAAQIAESTDEEDDVWTALKTYLVSQIQIAPPLELDPNAKKPKTIMLVGPTGVGKTTTLAKISARYRYANDSGFRPKIVFITADLYRLAAIEQLQKYSEILGAELEVTYSPEEVRQALKKHSDAHLVLFDTAGTCQRNMPQMSTLGSIVKASNPTEVHLVLSATTKFGDLVDIVNHFKEVNPGRLLFTKIDESTNFGSILNTIKKFGLPLSYLTTGQNVPEDIEYARADRIAKLLLSKPTVDRTIEEEEKQESESKKNESFTDSSDKHPSTSLENEDSQESPINKKREIKDKARQDRSDETKNS